MSALWNLEIPHVSNAMSEPLVIASQPADGVKVLSLNRPTKRNALSQDLIGQLLKELASASADDGVKAIIITGSTTFFCGTSSWKERSEEKRTKRQRDNERETRAQREIERGRGREGGNTMQRIRNLYNPCLTLFSPLAGIEVLIMYADSGC